MFVRLQLELETENKDFIPYYKAPILQSILMEQLSMEDVRELHVSRLHPYSQAIIHEGKKNIWSIYTTNEEAYQHILKPLQQEGFSAFTMEYDHWNVEIQKKSLFQITKDEFMEKYYFEDSDRYFKICFRTPTAFKQQGKYIYYPDIQLLYQSLMNKYDDAISDEALKSDEVLEQLVQYSCITQYNLKSTYYSVNGAKISAFTGQITVKVTGPQAMVNLVNLLFHFGEYSGVGIKTAMGMGNISILERVKA